MDDPTTPTLLRLSGDALDSFRVALPAGPRIQVRVQDLTAVAGDGSAPVHLQLAPGTSAAWTWPRPGSSGDDGSAAALVLQVDEPTVAELWVAGPGGHQVAVNLRVLDADDHGDSPGTATPVELGQPVAVQIDSGGDHDLLAFDLRHDERVRFDTASDAFGLTLVDPLGRTVASAAGALAHQPAMDGRYVLALEPMPGTGSARGLLRSGPAADDHPDTLDAGDPLPLGRVVGGTIDAPGDIDVLRLEVPGGQHVQLRLQAAPTCALSVFDGEGTWIESSRGLEPGSGAVLSWLQAPSDGHIFVALGALQAAPWELLATPVVGEDHPADIARATPVEPGQTILVQGDGPADVDALQWQALAGQRYRVQVEPASASREFLEGWVGSDGQAAPLRQVDRDDGTPMWTGGLTLEADGPAWVSLAGLPPGPSRVTLRADDADDHADTRGGATRVEAGTPVTGVSGPGHDVDAFLLELRPGEALRVRVQSGDDGGAWPVELRVSASTGDLLLAMGFDGSDPPLDLPAAASPDGGPLLVMLTSWDSHARSYVLTTEPVPKADAEWIHEHGLLTVTLPGVVEPPAGAGIAAAES